jgi:hypothetical protein
VKFFTPELIEMGSSDDDRILNEQDRLWDEAGDRYVAYLDTVRPQFPPGLRKIDESYYLHDAVIRGMGRVDRSFVIVLQLDTPPHSLLTFTYDLVEEPVINPDVYPADQRTPAHCVDWQYDEIEMVPGEPPTWVNTILLSNGWEVRLHFRDIQVQEAQALIPAPRNGQASVVTGSVPQSA